MRTRLHLVAVGLFVLLITAPTANMLFRLVPDAKLQGVTAQVSAPRLTWASVKSGEFQAGFEAWFNDAFGFKGHVVHLDNSLTYYLFRQTPPQSRVVVGRQGTLFVDEDIAFFNQQKPVALDALDAQVALLKEVQDELLERGKVLVPVLVPSKTSIYPEQVPPEWDRGLSAPRPSDVTYRSFVQLLEQRGVFHVDARRLLSEARRPDTPMFTSTGRHLNHLAACLTMVAVRAEVMARSDRSLPPVHCENPTYAIGPGEEENYDLARLLNVWTRRSLRPPMAQLPEVPLPSPQAVLPPAVFVGTSFSWGLIAQAERNHFFGPINYYYYNSTDYDRQQLTEAKLEPGTARWIEKTLAKDVFVIDIPEPYLPMVGSGFLPQLKAALEVTRPSVDLGKRRASLPQ